MQDIQYSNFFLAGLAAVGASVFTNPLEVKYELQYALTIALRRTYSRNSVPKYCFRL